jgi:hypothetical protein
MNGISICTLVLEFNYSEKPSNSLGTVWLYNGDGSNVLTQDKPIESIPNWVKIVGPIDYNIAKQIQIALKIFFISSGVSVIDHGITD